MNGILSLHYLAQPPSFLEHGVSASILSFYLHESLSLSKDHLGRSRCV